MREDAEGKTTTMDIRPPKGGREGRGQQLVKREEESLSDGGGVLYVVRAPSETDPICYVQRRRRGIPGGRRGGRKGERSKLTESSSGERSPPPPLGCPKRGAYCLERREERPQSLSLSLPPLPR